MLLVLYHILDVDWGSLGINIIGNLPGSRILRCNDCGKSGRLDSNGFGLMRDEANIEAHLLRVARGEVGAIRQLIPNLAVSIIYAPLVKTETLGDAQGTRKIKLATFVEDSRRYIPVFTSEDYFLDWSGEAYQCFSLAAGDLALSLPANTSMWINPGRPESVELSIDSVQELASIDEVSHSEEHEQRVEEPVLPLPPSLPEINPLHVQQDLIDLFDGAPEVLEAYYIEAKDSSSGPLLGILTEELNTERRFELIERIAEISRKYFAEAGAIEVYDDLHIHTSTSWTLFSAHTPFFLKSSRVEDRTKLAADMFKSDEYMAESQEYDNSSLTSRWNPIKKGAKFFNRKKIGEKR